MSKEYLKYFEDENSIDFLQNYCTFDNPNEIWMLKGITRHKDNEGDFHRFMRRLVITKPEDIEMCRKDIRRMGNKEGTMYRIYVSLNSRDVLKGMFQFQKKLLDISHGVARGLEDCISQTNRLASVWKTQLEQKGCRGTKRILLDVDSADEGLLGRIVDYLTFKMDTKIYTLRSTVSGYAVVIEACDTRGFLKEFKSEEVDMQRDSMVFVEAWKGTE